jgi:hypothetical protein
MEKEQTITMVIGTFCPQFPKQIVEFTFGKKCDSKCMDCFVM